MLDVLKTRLETVVNKPVFDPDFDTELIIKHEMQDSGAQLQILCFNKKLM